MTTDKLRWSLEDRLVFQLTQNNTRKQDFEANTSNKELRELRYLIGDSQAWYPNE